MGDSQAAQAGRPHLSRSSGFGRFLLSKRVWKRVRSWLSMKRPSVLWSMVAARLYSASCADICLHRPSILVTNRHLFPKNLLNGADKAMQQHSRSDQCTQNYAGTGPERSGLSLWWSPMQPSRCFAHRYRPDRAASQARTACPQTPPRSPGRTRCAAQTPSGNQRTHRARLACLQACTRTQHTHPRGPCSSCHGQGWKDAGVRCCMHRTACVEGHDSTSKPCTRC